MLYLLYRYSSVHALLSSPLLSSPLLSVPPTLLGPYAHIYYLLVGGTTPDPRVGAGVDIGICEQRK